MTSINSFHLIKQKVNKIKEENNIESDGFAFVRFALNAILKLNDEEVEEAITDGPNDGGIDAIYIQENEVNIMNFKYTNIFENTSNNFPENSIEKFTLTVSNLLSGNLSKGQVNDVLWEKYNEIKGLLDERGPLDFKLYIVSNLLKPTDLAMQKYETILTKFRFIDFIYYDLENLVSKIIEDRVEKIDGELTFIDKQYFEKSEGSIKTIIGAVEANGIIKLIQDSTNSENTNENVFDKNIRTYKLKHRINQDIIETALQDDNYQFFYLNNGITILCEECDYMPGIRSPKAKLKNLQIINGGQTSHSLFEAFKRNKEKISNVVVLVRICIAKKDNPITDKISESTNSQIPVQSRDLHSNDYIQKKLEEEFKVLGYYYERKNNQFQDKPKNKRLDNELLGQLYLSFYCNMASEARNSKAIVFGDKYELIFDENKITAETLLLPYKIYIPLLEEKKQVQAKKRNKDIINENDAFISRGVFHVISGVKIISEIKNFNLINKSDREEATVIAKKLIAEVVEEKIKEKNESYSHDKFFKETSTNKIIKDYILEKIWT